MSAFALSVKQPSKSSTRHVVTCRRYLKVSLAERVGRRKEILVVECLNGVRDAWSWLDDACVELYNGFCKRHASAAEVPHSFSFRLRCDLSGDELRMAAAAAIAAGAAGVAGGVAAESPNDVFCLVKTFMADARLQQAPLLVLPAARAQRVRATPNMVVKRHNLSERRARELASFARVLEQPAYNLRAAAAYMRHLVAPAPVCVDELPPLTWLERSSRREYFGGAHAPPPALREIPWNLKVRFKRLS
jgi:hypothetical protein